MIEVTSKHNITTVKGFVEWNGISLSVNAFLTDHMLIDTGPVALAKDLIPYYQQTEFDFVVLTHFHEDHTGCAPWIDTNKQVPIYIHSTSIKECLEVTEYPLFRKGFWGIREGFTAKPLGDEIWSRHHNWSVIHTPGHSYDHVVLLNSDTGVLFSGDLLVSPKPKGIMSDESVTQTISSIKLVLKLDFEHMYCSHLGYVENGKELLRIKLDYLENLNYEIIQLYNQGISVEMINKRIFPKESPLVKLSEYEWDSTYIIQSIIRENNLVKND